MVVVGTIMIVDVERDACIHRKSLEEFAHQLGIERTDLGCREIDVPDQKGAPGHIDRSAGQRIVHGQVH